MQTALVPAVGKVLFAKDRSLQKVLGLSDRWHALRESMLGGDEAMGDAGKIRDITYKAEWNSLISPRSWTVPEGIAGGWHIVNLVRSKELDDEGKVQDHCLNSGDAGKCKDGALHAFSIRDEEGRRQSTFTLKPVAADDAVDERIRLRNGKTLELDQHF